MAVTFELPNDIEQALRQELGNLEQAAKEAALVELYRQRKVTQYEFSRTLGITRLQAEGVLKRRDVIEDVPTEAEYQAAMARLQAISPK